MVSALCGDTPNFQATNAGTDRQPQVTRDQLDVEDPRTPERRRKQRGGVRGHAEHLRAALRVVNRQIERVRHGSRENAAEVMPGRLALDITAHQHDTRAEDELDNRARSQDGQKIVDGVERGRQVGVEKPDERRSPREPGQHSGAHRLGFPGARRLADDRHRFGRAFPHRLQHCLRAVLTPVVHHHQLDLRVSGDESQERVRVEPRGLVVARHDQSQGW